MRLIVTSFVLFWLVAASLPASAQVVLRVNGGQAAQISPGDLAKLPQHSAVLESHGKRVEYQGALMSDVLALGGVSVASELRGKSLSTYVAAIGTDEYEVVYSLAEFDPTLVDSGILIAYKREGQPLPANERPLRIIVPHDKRAARCLRLLKELDVVQLRK